MSVQWEIDFDYQKFEEVLYKACLEAFTDVQESLPEETFYAFFLTTTYLFENVGIEASTEEDLLRRSIKYHKDYNEKMEISLDDVKLYHRYNCPYSYWNKYSHLFEDAHQMLGDFSDQCQDLMDLNLAYIDDDGNFDIVRYLQDRLERKFLKVINRLDVLHIFEKTNKRENITLHFNQGDLDSIIHDPTFCMINPPDVNLRFERECTHINKLGQIISTGYYRK